MLSFCRLTSRNACLSSLAMSSPSISTCPSVGSINRFSIRRVVDLPEPESPIITKISPVLIEKSARSTPTVAPVAFKISGLVLPAFNISFARFTRLPKILVSPRTSIFVSALLSTLCCIYSLLVLKNVCHRIETMLSILEIVCV